MQKKSFAAFSTALAAVLMISTGSPAYAADAADGSKMTAFWGMVRIVRIRREDAKARRLAASAESLACAKAFLRGEVEYVDGGFATRQSSLKHGVQTRGASE